ncbi:MAG: hypothetical protein RLZZ528_1324 [Pseudomonadota bacterium]
MKAFLIAATAALAFTSPLAARADGAGSHGYQARLASADILVLETTGAALVASPVRGRAQLGTIRLVRLDGRLQQIDEVFLRAQVTAGAWVSVPQPSTRQAEPFPAWY